MCHSCSLESTAYETTDGVYSHDQGNILHVIYAQCTVMQKAQACYCGPGNLGKPPTCKLHIAEIRTCKPRNVFLHQRCHTSPAP